MDSMSLSALASKRDRRPGRLAEWWLHEFSKSLLIYRERNFSVIIWYSELVFVSTNNSTQGYDQAFRTDTGMVRKVFEILSNKLQEIPPKVSPRFNSMIVCGSLLDTFPDPPVVIKVPKHRQRLHEPKSLSKLSRRTESSLEMESRCRFPCFELCHSKSSWQSNKDLPFWYRIKPNSKAVD